MHYLPRILEANIHVRVVIQEISRSRQSPYRSSRLRSLSSSRSCEISRSRCRYPNSESNSNRISSCSKYKGFYEQRDSKFPEYFPFRNNSCRFFLELFFKNPHFF